MATTTHMDRVRERARNEVDTAAAKDSVCAPADTATTTDTDTLDTATAATSLHAQFYPAFDAATCVVGDILANPMMRSLGPSELDLVTQAGLLASENANVLREFYLEHGMRHGIAAATADIAQRSEIARATHVTRNNDGSIANPPQIDDAVWAEILATHTRFNLPFWGSRIARMNVHDADDEFELDRVDRGMLYDPHTGNYVPCVITSSLEYVRQVAIANNGGAVVVRMVEASCRVEWVDPATGADNLAHAQVQAV